MADPELLHLEPVRDDGVRAIQIGLGLWVVAGILLLLARDELADRGAQWWLGVCAAGFLIGLVQLAVLSRRRQLIRAREARAVEADAPLSSPADPGHAGPDSIGRAGAGPTD